MLIFLIVSVSLIIFSVLKSFYRLVRVYKFLLSSRASEDKSTECNGKKIDIIIPVYNETKTVGNSIRYFSKLENYCNVFYVTTSKEASKATYKEILYLMDKYKTKNIFLDNCPNTAGTMATQLNYIAKKLPDDSIIGIYNIDSFPKSNTFKYVLNNIRKGGPLQQVSYFNDDKKFIMSSAQNWQNRWSVVYELGKYISKAKLNFTYTIGHGLFIYKSDLDKYGYWSDKEINEDNELGYRILINNDKIRPIPFFEQAGFAKNLSVYIKQQSTWFNGPLYAFSYYKKNKKSFRNFLLSCLNFKAAVSWLLYPIFSLIVFILGVAFNYCHVSIVLFVAMISYLTVINYLSYKILKKYIPTLNYSSTSVLTDLFFFLIHSFGPCLTLFKVLLRKNTIKNKYNTEK